MGHASINRCAPGAAKLDKNDKDENSNPAAKADTNGFDNNGFDNNDFGNGTGEPAAHSGVW